MRRRDFLKGTAAALAVLAASPGDARQGESWVSLLPAYAYSTRANVQLIGTQRAMLSSHLYPQGTYVRDAFYGPWALGDRALSQEAYAWFLGAQRPDGQIPTAVPFDPASTELPPQDDDSALLFIIWTAVLAQWGGTPARDAAARAWAWVRARVSDGAYRSPAGPFRYWADTIALDVPDCLTHNQGLYVAALLAMRALELDYGGGHALAAAAERYRAAFAGGYGTLGQASLFASCQDVSVTYGEFLCRILFNQRVLSDTAILASVQRQLDTALVHTAAGTPAGVKVICAADGAFLPPDWYFASVLNQPGEYQNGGYWPMYTLVALALAERIRPDAQRRTLIGALVTHELGRDYISKEVMVLSPDHIGAYDPARSGYTWNAVIPVALRWAGVVG